MDVRVKQGIVGATLVVAGLLLGTRTSHEAAGQASAIHPQWEYKIVNVTDWLYRETGQHKADQPSRFADEFNRLGSAGWEYAGRPAETANNLLVFKRPKR